jgi:AraC family transcriptional regulator, regulatory protein of adaptative response / methylated-DNA-[protein]-cysteine methyltransferase
MTRTCTPDWTDARAADVLIPVIRTAATIGFAIAPCSLGFVIIAVSEQLVRSIMVGDDPEMLVSDLQNQFPDEALEIMEDDHAGLVPRVVDLIERPGRAQEPPRDADEIQIQVLNALNQVPGARLREIPTYAK